LYLFLFTYLFESGSEAHRTHKTADTHNGQIVGKRRRMAFPFRFRRGNAVPLAYIAFDTATSLWCSCICTQVCSP